MEPLIPHSEYEDLLPATKSLKRDNLHTFCLLVSDKVMYLISSSYSVAKLRYKPPQL